MKLVLQLDRLSKTGVIDWQQTQDFFTTTISSLKTATQDFKVTPSETVQSAIASSVDNWLQVHPVVFRIFTTIIWAIDHPVVSFAMIILILAIALSIVKALNRLLEILGLSLLQAPFKLIETVFKFSWLGYFGIKQKSTHKNFSNLDANAINLQNPPQRLIEISQRLQVLQQEHNELLQEAATILAQNKS
jgi:hypothetical protein